MAVRRAQAADLQRQSGRASMKPNENIGQGESVAQTGASSMPYVSSARVGTHPAIISLIISGTAFSEEAQPSGWGGARNSVKRTSDFLTLNQCLKIIGAAQLASRIGLPFNRHITIHWEQAGIPDSRAAWATGRFLKLAGDWLAKRCQLENNRGKSKRRLAWAWVRENGSRKGSHVHILLHCPPELAQAFAGTQRRWLGRITGKPYRARTIRTARIGGTLNAARSKPAAYTENLANVVGYVLKGALPDAAATLGLLRLEAGGRVIGKRTATSQNIGQAARQCSIESHYPAELKHLFG